MLLTFKRLAIPTVALLLTSGLAACGEDSEADAATGPPEPVAAIESLAGVRTEVAFDAAFVAALQKLGVTPAPVAGATIKNGTAAFPITGGTVTYYPPGSRDPYVEGFILHDQSGLSLTAGKGKDATVVELRDFTIDPGESQLIGDVLANGKPVLQDAYLFFLDGRTLEPLVNLQGGEALLKGTTVKLSPPAAELLNKTFKVDAFKPFFTVGIASIILELPPT